MRTKARFIGLSAAIVIVTLALTPIANADPVVTLLNRSSGPAAGGTAVTITGSNFIVGATTVKFGTANGTSVSCSSTTRCTATSPAGSNTVSVRVTTSTGTSSDTLADNFTYRGAQADCWGYSARPHGGTDLADVAIGDFNDDGRSDLAFTDKTANTVSIRLGTATGIFGAAATYAVGNAPTSVAIGDFNGDDRDDLAVANSASTFVSILLGTGTGTVGVATSIATPAEPSDLAVSDFNGDGQTDIVVVNEDSGNAMLLPGNGSGGFAAPVNAAIGVAHGYAVATGDFNGDGRSDLAIATGTNVRILLGSGTGSFGTGSTFGSSVSREIATGDLNNDGFSDLAIAGWSQVAFILGTGTGTFGTLTAVPGINTDSHAVAIGDVNNDGRNDIVAGLRFNLSVSLGTGTGTFAAATFWGWGSSVAIGDFNGDGRSDLASTESTGLLAMLGSNCAPVVTSISPTTGPITGGTVVTIDGSNFIVGATTIAFGANPGTSVSCASTKQCIATSPAGTNSVRVRVTNALGNSVDTSADDFTYTAAATTCAAFTPAPGPTVGTAPRSAAVADFDEDGRSDLVVANFGSNNVSVLLNTVGGFVETTGAMGTGPTSVAVGDFNNDGNSDIVTANEGSNNVSIRLGTGTGTFGGVTHYAVGTGPTSVAVGDFDGDGKSDLAVANFASSNVSVLFGTGTGTFGAAANHLAGTNPRAVAVRDLADGTTGNVGPDGRSDVAVANYGSNNLSILVNGGGATFGAMTYSTGTQPGSVAIGEFNTDGNHDLVIANRGSNNVTRIRSLGTSFGTSTFAAGTNPTSVATGDLNGDGRVDVAIANYTANSVSILLNTGTTFAAAAHFNVGTNPQAVAIGDFNGDGRGDLAVVNEGSNDVSILLGSVPVTGALSLSSATYSVNEGGGPATITVERTGGSDCSVTVTLATSNGTATSGTDYTTTSSTVSFGYGVTTQTVNVPITNNGDSEADETFTVTLTNPVGASLGALTSGIVTIVDDDGPLPTLAIDNVSQNEGTGGATNYVFTATLTGTTAQTVTVNYATANGSAIEPADYTSTSGLLTFLPGTFTQQIIVPVSGDALNETDELFTVELSSPTSATISTATGTGTIQNDDAAPTLAIDNISQVEGTGGSTNFGFTVTLTGSTAQTVTVGYTTAPGTATAPADYTTTTGTLTFAPGTLTQPITVAIATDATNEIDEGFTVVLSGATIATITTATGTGTIQNDDAAPTLAIDNVSQTEGNTSLAFTVTLVGATEQIVTVDYATANGTAIAPGDYTATSGTLTFPPGTLTQPIAVPIVGDSVNESDELFTVALSGATIAAITTATGTGTIQNDDAAPTLAIDNVTQAEGTGGATNFVFTVTLTGSTEQTATVNYTTNLGTATAPDDYTTASGTLTFAPGTLTQTITVQVAGDAVNETGEAFTVLLSGATIATITTATGTGTIQNDDAAPTLTIDNISQVEGTGGSTNFAFTVTLTGSTAQTVTVGYTTTPGTATASADYTTATGTLTFAPGTLTQSITVAIAADATNEINEGFTVVLSGATIATITTATGTGTIQNDDAAPTLAIDNVSQTEANTSLAFTVTLLGTTEQIVTVDYATANNTATAPGDYAATSGTLTFPPGTLTQPIAVPIVGDAVNETDEIFTVGLSGATVAAITTATGTGTIQNDDPVPTLAIDSISRAEGTGGSTNFVFTVTLTGSTAQTVTVNYTTNLGTATAPGDYTTTSGTLTFAPGTLTQTISVQVAGDAVNETGETFTVLLSGATVATIATGTGTGTIQNDDASPTLAIDNVTQAEGNSGATSFVFTLTLTGATEQTVTVDYNTTDGTAAASGDYATTSGTLTFAPGTTTRSVDVSVAGDTVNEPNEAFTVNLSGAVNGTINTAIGNGTIVNDDGPPSLLIDNVGQTEGNGATSNLVFTVTLAGTTTQTVTVDYTTSNGAATAAADYSTTSGTLTFPPGTLTQSIPVSLNGDVTYETDETLTVELSGATNATIATASGTGTIQNDDAPPALAIDDGAQNATSFVFTVTLTGATALPATVDYATSDGTAIAPGDYTTTTGTLTFATGTTTQTITVPLAIDVVFEPSETFSVNLSSPNLATITRSSGTGTIVDAAADLSLTNTVVESGPYFTGETLTYRIVVTNHGPDAASDVLMTDPLPAGMDFVSAASTQGTCGGTAIVSCSVGTLANGANVTITLVVRLTAAGSTANAASVTSSIADPVNENGSAAAVVPVVAAAVGESIPTLSGWMLLAFAGLMAGLAIMRART
ncbi:MAG TPA: Calx-beta domain-containing protein [Thermoanaerobaculia bacterium]|nr:Calx-beta domain-containing protein [Thermoanaerobaculia bacterium]